MPKRTLDLTAPYQPFRGASRITGLSIGFLREGGKGGGFGENACYCSTENREVNVRCKKSRGEIPDLFLV